jgi:hypothetical protein
MRIFTPELIKKFQKTNDQPFFEGRIVRERELAFFPQTLPG